jgi:hypothetical protein
VEEALMPGPWEKYQSAQPGPWTKYQAGADRGEKAIEQANKNTGFFENAGKGLLRGAESRVLGMIQAGADLLPDGVVSDGFRQDMADVARQLALEGKGTGAGGLVGEIVGDPLTAATLPVGGAGSLTKLAGQGAALGAAGGFTTPQAEGGLGDRALNAVVGAGVGAAIPTAIEGGKIVAGKAVRAISPLQTKGMAKDKALDAAAKVLKKEGYTPAQVTAALQESTDSGLGATLAEATGSRGLLARQKNIAKGSGSAADELSRAVINRNEQTIPAALADLAKPLQDKGQQGIQELAQVLQANGAKQVPVDDIVTGLIDKAAKANPNNAEGRIYRAVLDELGFAEQNGNTFDALHRAKQGLDNIYIEGADDALRSRATRITAEVRKAINERLKQIAPAYGAANRKIQAGMVADDLNTAIASTNEGSIAALYNKFWAKPELRADMADRLEPADYAKLSKAMEVLKKIKRGGMAGSDTAENLATRAEMAMETGAPGLEAVTDPTSFFGIGNAARKVSDAVRQKDLQAMQELLTKPDAAAIAGRMAGRGTAAPGAASKAATAAGVIGTSQPDQPATERPRAVPQPTPEPQEQSALPNSSQLLDRIAQAESGGDPNAKNSIGSASGLLQFTNDTWAKMVARYGKQTGIGLKDKNNPKAQMVMGELLTRDNGRVLSKGMGREPTDGELYAAHFLGASDALKLIKAQGSGKQAILLFPRRVVADNRAVFFEGKRPRTVEEVMEIITSKVA